MKKRILLLIVALSFILLFSACDVVIDVKSDNSAIITIECDEDDVEDAGIDPDDLEDLDDLEDIYEDYYEDFMEDTDVEVLSFRKNDDDYILQLRIIPSDDIEEAMYDGIAIGNAEEILDYLAENDYGDDFEDIYDKELSDDIDDEYIYAWDGSGDSLDDGDFEDLCEANNFSNLKCVSLYISDDVVVKVPCRIKMVLAYGDDVDIDGNSVEGEDTSVYIVYTSGLGTLGIILIVVAVLLLAGGAVLLFVLLRRKGRAVIPS